MTRASVDALSRPPLFVQHRPLHELIEVDDEVCLGAIVVAIEGHAPKGPELTLCARF